MAQMGGGTRRRAGGGGSSRDIDTHDLEELLRKWNAPASSQALVRMAMYFASARTAADVRMSDADAAGFTLSYIEKNPDFGLQRIETRIQFDRPVERTQTQIHRKLQAMAEEARIVLDLKPNKNYVAPGTRQPVLFEMPEPSHWIVVLCIFATLVALAFAPTLPPIVEAIRMRMGGASTFVTILFTIVGIHALEALVAVGVGLWCELPGDIIFKWWLVTHFFGIASLGRVIKIASKRHAELDSTKEIQK